MKKEQLMEKIKELNNDPILFFINNDSHILLEIIKYVNKQYHNNISVISDALYDVLIEIIKDLDPNNIFFKKIGAKVVRNKVKLPYFMGSMDKIKTEDINILKKWIERFNKPYVYSDKLDGVSALLINKEDKLNLYTRGDGNIGSDISHLIEYIPSIKNIKLNNGMCVRGELIISIEKFKKYETKMANSRNMISGIVNSIKLDYDILKDIDYVAYELINPWLYNQLEQWKILKEYNFKVVNYNILKEDITFELLSKLLIDRNNKSEYEIDGLIISTNNLPQRTIDSNPKYAFAFKDINILETADVKVINIEWNISKDGYLKPKINCNPTKLGGVIISNITAINAKYVKDNILGPGAIVKIVRSGGVIPKILEVIKKSDSGYPQFPVYDYEWTKSNVDIIIKTSTLQQKIKELTFFFKKLNIKDIDEKLVEKLINVGIDNIKKIIEIKIEDLDNVEGFKDKMKFKIYNNIINRIKNLTILDLAVASNYFGHGIGEKKLEKIFNKYPNIIELYSKKDIIDKIIEIEGFDIKTATQFTNNLSKFIRLIRSLDQNIFIEKKEKNGKLFTKMIIVFTGFRDEKIKKFIIDNDGKINENISNNTTLLVATQESIDKNINNKIIKAKELNIPIISKENFIKEYII